MQELTLKHFLLKQRVLCFYRQAIRASRSIPDTTARKETLWWIRGEIQRNRYLHDVSRIEDALSSCRRELRQILPSM